MPSSCRSAQRQRPEVERDPEKHGGEFVIAFVVLCEVL